jgi:hypothetical protein
VIIRGITTAARYLWAAPASAVGVWGALLALRGGHVAVVDGVLEAHGPLLGRILQSCSPLSGGTAAITFGHVVLARDAAALECTRGHERVHVAQYERWGPLFIPAYLAVGAWAWYHGLHPYFDNRFEQEARFKGRWRNTHENC